MAAPDAPMQRVVLSQSAEWYRNHDRLSTSVYDQDRCCYCYRKVRPSAPMLLIMRDNGGEWYVISRALPVTDDEKDFGRFELPIGPDCLRQHPEFRIGLGGLAGAVQRESR